MHILFSGRSAFLEFLRNLTPQVLLLTMALILSSRLDFTQCDLGNTPMTVTFFACIATFFMAVITNALNFFEGSISSLDWLNKRAKKADRRVRSSRGRLCFLIRTLNRRKWKFAADTIVAIVVVQVGLVSASSIGIFTAIKTMALSQ